MHHFATKNGVLHAEDVNLLDLATNVCTPFYCYSTATLVRHYQVFRSAFIGVQTLVCYAVKANSNQAVLTTLARQGAGMDVVSEGELRRALAAGVPAERITFSGVGKTKAEIAYAIKVGIFCFNVESEPELHALSSVAEEMGRVAPVALRINPDVDPKTHAKISTGRAENKFGVPITQAREVYGQAARMSGIELVGVDVHIGSQITELSPFDRAFGLAASLVRELRSDGIKIKHIDFGGGLGIPYREDDDPEGYHPQRYAQIVKNRIGDLDCRLILEPGRLIVGNAGILVTRVIYVKDGATKSFIIVDAGMNDLLRPTLYDAHHEIKPVVSEPDREISCFDIVGPVCESGDYFALGRRMQRPHEGDILAIMSVGAYCAVQAGTYNSRLLIPEVLVDRDQYSIVRPRGSYDDLIGLDRTPAWLR